MWLTMIVELGMGKDYLLNFNLKCVKLRDMVLHYCISMPDNDITVNSINWLA